MAITFVGSATGSVIDSGTVTIDLTAIAGLAENDIVVVFGQSSSGTPATPSGWTTIYNLTARANGIFYKIMSGSPDTSVSLWDVGAGFGHSGTGIAMAFRGVDTSTPLDVAYQRANITSPDAPDPPSITPTSDNCCIVVFGGDIALDGSVGTITDYSVPVTITSDDDNDATCAVAYRILTGGAGVAEDPGAFSTWATTFATAATLALRPAAAAGQPYDLHEGGVKFVNPHHGGQNFQVWRTMLGWRKSLAGVLMPPKPRILRPA